MNFSASISLTKKISIIYLTKTKIKVTLVKLGKDPKIIKSDEFDWHKDSLVESFKQVKKQLKTKSIRLLLANDLTYTLELNIPFDTKPVNERQLVEEKIKSEIPEILDHDDWGFKETGLKTQKDKQIIAFAPIKSAFTLISQALVDADLKVEVIEPEAISKIRNNDPLIGLALKKENLSSKKKPPKINKSILIIFFITLILASLITGGILVQKNALDSRSQPTPTPLAIPSSTSISTPTPTPTPTPSPSPEPEIVLSDYSIQVLNGTGGKGVAGAVKDLLEAEGFVDIKADNADEFDHQKTTVQLKPDTPNAVWETINRTLNLDYELLKNEAPLTKDEEYDVIITVGELLED